MQGTSRAALTTSRHALNAALSSGADWARLSDELFSVVSLLDDSATLRRALAEPSREGQAKGDLAYRLLNGKVSEPAARLVATVAMQRWSSDRDLVDALEQLAVEARLACAESGGRADALEEDLFRFERTVAGNPALRDALSDPAAPTDRKVALVERLLAGKVGEEARALAVHAVAAPRGRGFAAAVEDVLAVAAERRQQLTALVSVAVPLTQEQENRLRGSLASLYGKPVLLQTVVDPSVLGGIRVQVGDEVVDGTIVRRLDEARRHLGA